MADLRELIHDFAVELAQSSDGWQGDIGDALLFVLANDWALRVLAAVICVLVFYALLKVITHKPSADPDAEVRHREHDKLRVRDV